MTGGFEVDISATMTGGFKLRACWLGGVLHSLQTKNLANVDGTAPLDDHFHPETPQVVPRRGKCTSKGGSRGSRHC